MKKYIINGASGFIGFELIKRLLRFDDIEIYALTSSLNSELLSTKARNLKVFQHNFSSKKSLSSDLVKPM
jgi:N-acetyl-gamma-glutamylphosphate reductase